MKRCARRGILLIEVIASFFLMSLAAFVVLNLLSVSDRGYSQASEASIALRLAQEGLDRVRGTSVVPVSGTQTLTNVTALSGKTALVFTPEIISVDQSSVWLVTSRVRWGPANARHTVELRTFVAK